jgi:hypothetical protein
VSITGKKCYSREGFFCTCFCGKLGVKLYRITIKHLYDKILVSRNYQEVVPGAGYLGAASAFEHDLTTTPMWNPEARSAMK